jgi:hypothetical protein
MGENVSLRATNARFAWTTNGLLMSESSRGGTDLFVRAANGRMQRRIATGTGGEYVFDATSQTLLFITRDRMLWRTDGIRTAALSDLRTLGLRSPSTSMCSTVA